LPIDIPVLDLLPKPAVVMLRNIASHPIRAGLTTLGMASATGIVIASLFLGGTMENLIDVTYFLSDRQDATVSFVERRQLNAVVEIARLPGVLSVEPLREVPVRIRNGGIERRVMISGRPRDADLSRIVDTDLHPVVLPETGMAISAWLGRILGVRVGDFVEADLLEGQRRTVTLPVTALVEDYFGIQGMMDADALAHLVRESPAVTSVNLSLDANEREPFFKAIKRSPAVAGLALQRASLANFRAAIAVLVTAMGNIYTGLAAVIAFGVVFNSARIALSERARELASLRVLGFTRGEVMRMLFLELALLTVAAQPPGWAIGYGLAWALKTNMEGQLMRARLVVEHSTYSLATAIVMVAALLSALVVRQRINQLDLVAVLKARD
jgi:putative ABC transport system permease protein